MQQTCSISHSIQNEILYVKRIEFSNEEYCKFHTMIEFRKHFEHVYAVQKHSWHFKEIVLIEWRNTFQHIIMVCGIDGTQTEILELTSIDQLKIITFSS